MPKRTKQQQLEAWKRVFDRIRERRQNPDQGDDPAHLDRLEREFYRLHGLDVRDGLIDAQPRSALRGAMCEQAGCRQPRQGNPLMR